MAIQKKSYITETSMWELCEEYGLEEHFDRLNTYSYCTLDELSRLAIAKLIISLKHNMECNDKTTVSVLNNLRLYITTKYKVIEM